MHTTVQRSTPDYFMGTVIFMYGYKFLTVDSVNKVLFIIFFDAEEKKEIISMLYDFYTAEGKWDASVKQDCMISLSSILSIFKKRPKEALLSAMPDNPNILFRLEYKNNQDQAC